MSSANGYVLKLSPKRLQVFEERAGDDQNFGEPVPDFVHSRSVPLICFLVSASNAITHICLSKRGVKSGTGLRRLNLNESEKVVPAIPIVEIQSHISTRHRNLIAERFKDGGLLTAKAFSALVEALLKERPELMSLLNRFSSSFRNRIANIPPKAKEQLAFQKEAVLTALSLATEVRDYDGDWKEVLQDWEPPSSGQPVSFLEGLPVARVREDPMVIHDMTNVPGFSLIRTLPYGAAIFESDGTRLTVVLANRLPLEEQVGADLIYYNEKFKCFLMVQYKAMEPDGDQKDVFRVPNKQLNKELQRMNDVLVQLKACGSSKSVGGYRLNDNPFFLKFCRRIVFKPDDVGMVDGMYLPLGYWERLAVDPILKGPRGGLGVRYDNVGRYLDNSAFRNMVANGWIGSTPEQSAVLESAIKAALELGKAVVIAVKTTLPPPKPAE